jgi:hypothetical protein
MTDTPAAIDEPAGGAWFCDQCGSRYPHPGECANQHPPVELKPVEESTVPELDDENNEQTQEAAPEADPALEGTEPPAPGHPFQETIDALEQAGQALADALDHVKSLTL